MLRIRLTRTGKKSQPSFRVVVAEKSKAVKRKYMEMLGHYAPAENPKKLNLKKERIEYWISMGAQPSESVASLLKKNGFEDMDRYMSAGKKQRKKKAEASKEEEGKPATSKAAKEKSADAPKEEEPAQEPEKATEEKSADAPKEEEPAAA